MLPPARLVGAVEALPLIEQMNQVLAGRGALYEVERDMYFSRAADPAFGAVSHLDPATMAELSAERGGDPGRPGKKDPLDPMVWLAARPGEPSWDSGFGPGRPGWHVECAAIATAYLGEDFDVQAGGSDLIFPHHEFSASHARVAFADGAPGHGAFARCYAHAGMVRLDGEKMSKSLGNLVFVSRLVADGVDPMAVRLAILAHHYRGDWDWTAAGLAAAQDRLARWRAAVDLAVSGAGSGPSIARSGTGLRGNRGRGPAADPGRGEGPGGGGHPGRGEVLAAENIRAAQSVLAAEHPGRGERPGRGAGADRRRSRRPGRAGRRGPLGVGGHRRAGVAPGPGRGGGAGPRHRGRPARHRSLSAARTRADACRWAVIGQVAADTGANRVCPVTSDGACRQCWNSRSRPVKCVRRRCGRGGANLTRSCTARPCPSFPLPLPPNLSAWKPRSRPAIPFPVPAADKAPAAWRPGAGHRCARRSCRPWLRPARPVPARALLTCARSRVPSAALDPRRSSPRRPAVPALRGPRPVPRQSPPPGPAPEPSLPAPGPAPERLLTRAAAHPAAGPSPPATDPPAPADPNPPPGWGGLPPIRSRT